MKKTLSLWQLAGFTFAMVLGTVLHFLYGWTGSIAVTPFSAVNESTWEHMKILFFPTLLFAGIQSRFFKKEYKNFWKIKTVGILLGVVGIPVLFYTYSGAIGTPPAWLNVLFFFLAGGLAYLWEWRAFQKVDGSHKGSFFAVLLLIGIAAAFVVFTYLPPTLPLFQDPVTGGYGLVVAY